jgi:hypothetical protein
MINVRPELRFPTFGILGMAVVLLTGGCGSSSPAKDARPADATVDQGHAEAAAPDSSPDGGSAGDGASEVDASDDATVATPDADTSSATDGGTDVVQVDTGTDAADDVADAGVDATSTDGATEAPDDASATDGDGPDLPPIQGPLRAYWRFDEGTGTAAADSSANGVASTLYMGTTWTTTGFPAATFTNPAALVLDGVDDFVDLGVRAIPGNAEPKTVSVWFWQAAPSTTAARENVISLTDFLNTGFGTQIGLDAGHVSVWFMGEVTGLVTDPAVAAAGWHHLAYSYDGTVHRLYVDAVLVGEVTRASTAAPVTTAYLGGFNVLGLEMFAGRIDDVRIYDSALSLATITAINGGAVP